MMGGGKKLQFDLDWQALTIDELDYQFNVNMDIKRQVEGQIERSLAQDEYEPDPAWLARAEGAVRGAKYNLASIGQEKARRNRLAKEKSRDDMVAFATCFRRVVRGYLGDDEYHGLIEETRTLMADKGGE